MSQPVDPQQDGPDQDPDDHGDDAEAPAPGSSGGGSSGADPDTGAREELQGSDDPPPDDAEGSEEALPPVNFDLTAPSRSRRRPAKRGKRQPTEAELAADCAHIRRLIAMGASQREVCNELEIDSRAYHVRMARIRKQAAEEIEGQVSRVEDDYLSLKILAEGVIRRMADIASIPLPGENAARVGALRAMWEIAREVRSVGIEMGVLIPKPPSKARRLPDSGETMETFLSTVPAKRRERVRRDITGYGLHLIRRSKREERAARRLGRGGHPGDQRPVDSGVAP